MSRVVAAIYEYVQNTPRFDTYFVVAGTLEDGVESKEGFPATGGRQLLRMRLLDPVGPESPETFIDRLYNDPLAACRAYSWTSIFQRDFPAQDLQLIRFDREDVAELLHLIEAEGFQ